MQRQILHSAQSCEVHHTTFPFNTPTLVFQHALVQRALPLMPGLHPTLPRLLVFQIVPMSFRISDSFINFLWGVQTVRVLHIFHTSSPRWAMGYFCRRTIRFGVRVFVQAQFASCPYCNWSQMLLMPCTRIQHFLLMKTVLHPSISSAKNTFISGTSCTFHSPLC